MQICTFTTTPAHHHSVFYRPDALLLPTNSNKALKAQIHQKVPEKSNIKTLNQHNPVTNISSYKHSNYID